MRTTSATTATTTTITISIGIVFVIIINIVIVVLGIIIISSSISISLSLSLFLARVLLHFNLDSSSDCTTHTHTRTHPHTLHRTCDVLTGLYIVNQGRPADASANTNNVLVASNTVHDLDQWSNLYRSRDNLAFGIQGGVGNLFEKNIIFNVAGSCITFYQGKFSFTTN